MARPRFFEQLNATLRRKLRKATGRNEEPSAAILDAQSVKTTETKGVRGYDAGKKVKGRKRHILVDTMGLLLECSLSPALIIRYQAQLDFIHLESV